jgi:uncharacterized membrane protein YhaH (DUF805 family)
MKIINIYLYILMLWKSKLHSFQRVRKDRIYLMSIATDYIRRIYVSSKRDWSLLFLAKIKQRLGSQHIMNCAPPYRNSALRAPCPIPVPHLPWTSHAFCFIALLCSFWSQLIILLQRFHSRHFWGLSLLITWHNHLNY